MERLTTMGEDGEVYRTRCDISDEEAWDKLAAYESSGLEPEEIPTGLELANVFCAMQKLKEYEDTGLSPKICAEYKKFEDEAISKGVTFKRIIDLMKEEQERKNSKPLGIEDLQKMDGQPVWVEFSKNYVPVTHDYIPPLWMIVSASEKELHAIYEYVNFSDPGWFAYRYPPKHPEQPDSRTPCFPGQSARRDSAVERTEDE